jgi:molybdopterin converting factor small subunit
MGAESETAQAGAMEHENYVQEQETVEELKQQLEKEKERAEANLAS